MAVRLRPRRVSSQPQPGRIGRERRQVREHVAPLRQQRLLELIGRTAQLEFRLAEETIAPGTREYEEAEIAEDRTTNAQRFKEFREEVAAEIGRRGWFENEGRVLLFIGSVLLLVTSGLLVRTLQTALAIEHGFQPQGVLAFELDLRLSGYDEPRGRNFYGLLLDRLNASAEIDSAALANIVPLGLSWDQTRLKMPGLEAPEPEGFAIGFNVFAIGKRPLTRV